MEEVITQSTLFEEVVDRAGQAWGVFEFYACQPVLRLALLQHRDIPHVPWNRSQLESGLFAVTPITESAHLKNPAPSSYDTYLPRNAPPIGFSRHANGE